MALQAVFVINIAYAAQKRGRLRIAEIFHSVRFHAGDIDGVSRSADGSFYRLIGLRVVLVALELPTDNIHGLMIEVIVNGNFSPRLGGKMPQSVLWIPRTVVTVL